MHPRFSVTGFLLTSVLFVYSRNIPWLVWQAATDEAQCLSTGPHDQDESLKAGAEISSAGSTAHQQVLNATVGFEKVYTISLPERSDRRDAFTLQARLSNISFEFRDGVIGSDISPKALPLVCVCKSSSICFSTNVMVGRHSTKIKAPRAAGEPI